MKTSLPFVLSLFVAFFSLHTSFAQHVEERQLSSFTKTHISSALSVVLQKGSQTSARIEVSDPSYLPEIITQVENNVLKVYVDTKRRNWNGKIMVYITYTQEQEQIKVSGASTLKATDALKNPNLTLDVSGASTFKATIQAKRLQCNVIGASHVVIEGSAQELTLDAAGASSIKAASLQVDKAKLQIAGASSVGLNIKEDLEANVSGASTLRYSGNPPRNVQNVTGASSSKQL
ncbi:head GIN domain-containing protein [Eisenibacter elegans]|jgi:hypothetical protein|uniref:head GIN domain-containing protein n=1 Tax=Eisenibacter elegans TaxID=997 RepID=UPI000423E571|nr:head GIN domain-containing protein [Eisenibacter elegans]